MAIDSQFVLLLASVVGTAPSQEGRFGGKTAQATLFALVLAETGCTAFLDLPLVRWKWRGRSVAGQFSDKRHGTSLELSWYVAPVLGYERSYVLWISETSSLVTFHPRESCFAYPVAGKVKSSLRRFSSLLLGHLNRYSTCDDER